jgi:dihydrofolate reductase
MGKVLPDITVSLDGFIAGPNYGDYNPLGDGEEQFFDWMRSGPEANRYNEYFQPPDSSHVVVDEWYEQTRAIVSGRRTYDIAGGWGGRHPLNVPFFVLTHTHPNTAPEKK